MRRLEPGDYQRAAPLFRNLAEHHLSVGAVLAGMAPGELWVDDITSPSVGFISGPEGEYLAGATDHRAIYPALRALLPEKAYLTLDPHEWAQLLPQIWANRAARRHPRLYLRWRRRTLPQWRALLPPAFELVAVDAALLGRHGLQHYDELVERVSAWHSTGDFLQNGFGFCVIHGSAIVSRCIADCVVGDRCEIGVGTSLDYRGRGLAAAVVAATVEHCLERGFKQIGWHCLRSNAGSRALAEKVGFELVTEYNAYSAVLPAENAHDLAAAEYRDWALHYEHFVEESFWYRLFAAEAWALAGERARALEHLRALVESDWHGHATWLAQRWGLHSLRDQPEFQAILAALPGGS